MAVINLYVIIRLWRQTSPQVFLHSSIQVFKCAGIHVIMQSCIPVCMYACMRGFIPACTLSCSHAVTLASLHTGKQMLRQSGITNKKKDIFPKETEKEKRKRKQFKRTGCRQTIRKRNKSRRVFCEERAKHYAVVFWPGWSRTSYLVFLFYRSFG